MYYMFSYANSLEALDVSNWHTANVTDMRSLFYQMSAVKELDVSNWDTSNVKQMSYLFNFTRSLKRLDLSSWNNTKMTNGLYMLANMDSLETLVLSSQVNLPHSVYLSENTSVLYTGEWLHEESNTLFVSTSDFLINYKEAGTYT